MYELLNKRRRQDLSTSLGLESQAIDMVSCFENHFLLQRGQASIEAYLTMLNHVPSISFFAKQQLPTPALAMFIVLAGSGATSFCRLALSSWFLVSRLVGLTVFCVTRSCQHSTLRLLLLCIIRCVSSTTFLNELLLNINPCFWLKNLYCTCYFSFWHMYIRMILFLQRV